VVAWSHDELFPGHVSTRQALSEYRVMLGAALTAGVTPVEAKEIVYQAVAYAGRGKVFDFIAATNDVLTERAAHRRPHRPRAVHWLPPHAQRARRPQRGRAHSYGEAELIPAARRR
jgi:hypothetical protein